MKKLAFTVGSDILLNLARKLAKTVKTVSLIASMLYVIAGPFQSP